MRLSSICSQWLMCKKICVQYVEREGGRKCLWKELWYILHCCCQSWIQSIHIQLKFFYFVFSFLVLSDFLITFTSSTVLSTYPTYHTQIYSSLVNFLCLGAWMIFSIWFYLSGKSNPRNTCMLLTFNVSHTYLYL